MVLCTAVAATTLGWWLVGRAGVLLASVPDRLADSFLDDAPSRAVATAVLGIVGFLAVPRAPASAEPAPPIVRLAEQRATEPDGPANADPDTTYEVVRGDSLWCIAASTLRDRSGERPTSAAIAAFWPQLYQANHQLIGADPNLILPGQQLVIPDP